MLLFVYIVYNVNSTPISYALYIVCKKKSEN